jgi:DNA-binding response OmpR family regulator
MDMVEQDRPAKILVVDDEAAVRGLLRHFLQRQGHAVEEADDFDQVRCKLEAHAFDLVSLDIVMPGASGLEVLRWLREHYPDLGVVMATAIDNLDAVIEAMRLGAHSYILKPLNLDLVGQEVERALERQRLIAQNRAYQQHLERMVELRTQQLSDTYAQLEKAHAQLLRKVRELEGRDRLVQIQMSPPEQEQEACAEIVQAVIQAVQVERAALYRPDESGRLRAGTGEEALPENAPATRAFLQGQPLDQDERAWVPVLYNQQALGVLEVEGVRGEEEERKEKLHALWRLGREAALVLRMVQMAQDLEEGRFEVEELLKLAE